MLLCITFLSQPEKKSSKRGGAFTEQEMEELREHFSTYWTGGKPHECMSAPNSLTLKREELHTIIRTR